MTEAPGEVDVQYQLLYDSEYKPERSPLCAVKTIFLEGRPSHVLKNGVSSDFYEIDDFTSAVWELLDGTRTLAQLHLELAKNFPGTKEKEVRDVLLSLAEDGTIKGSERKQATKQRVKSISAFQVDVNLLGDSNSALGSVYSAVRPLLRRPLLVATVVFVGAASVIFTGTFLALLQNKSSFAIEGSVLLGWFFYNLLALLPIYAIHEISHGLACMHYGGKPGEMGTGLFYFSPMFYVDTTDSWRLERWPRIMVSLAGPLSTVLIGSVLAVASVFVAPGFGKTFLLLSAFFSFYGTLLNLSPVIENDGYYALTDILDMPNLKEDSFDYIRRLLLRLLPGRRSSKVPKLGRRRELILLGFAVVAGGWLIFFLYTTTILMTYLAQDAAGSAFRLGGQVLLFPTLDSGVVAASLASIGYFALLLTGYAYFVESSVRRLRRRRVKLETIHDKMVTVFLPLTSRAPDSLVGDLLRRAKKVARDFSHTISVVWEAPFCTVTIKMGEARESLMDIRSEMQKVEREFRAMYTHFLSANAWALVGGGSAPGKSVAKRLLSTVSKQISGYSRSEAGAATEDFIRRSEDTAKYLINSAMSSVWSLDLSPDEYRRIEPRLFPALIAEDLSETNLYGGLEDFKKHRILGLESITRLAVEVKQEMSEVSRNPAAFQAATFIEPVKGRLVVVGRTDALLLSHRKVAEMFLYRTWSGFFDRALNEAYLGLLVAQNAPGSFKNKSALLKLYDNEAYLLNENLWRFRSLEGAMGEALEALRLTHERAQELDEEARAARGHRESASAFVYEFLEGISLEGLGAVKKRIESLHTEYRRVLEEFNKIESTVTADLERAKEKQKEEGRRLRSVFVVVLVACGLLAVSALAGFIQFLASGTSIAVLLAAFGVFAYFQNRSKKGVSRLYTPAFDAAEVALLTATQSIYQVLLTGDLFGGTAPKLLESSGT